jgi:hypothetical protein
VDRAFASHWAGGQVIDGECTGLRVNLDLRGVVEPATVGLRRKHEGGILTAEIFLYQVLIPNEQVLDILSAAPAPTMQAKDQRIGITGVKVDGIHQPLLNALQFALQVEGKRFEMHAARIV